jgi:hypothetical protein
MTDEEIRANRAQIVFTMLMARLQKQGRSLTDMTPEQIHIEVKDAVEVLKIAEEALS